MKFKMEKKFNFKGLTIYLHPEVYEPAEDTFLLLDTIDTRPDDMVFEMGTGTGIIGLYCSMLGADVVCSDINPLAIELTKKNYLINQNLLKGNFDVRTGDLFSVLDEHEKFDKIIFNPPYLPTKPEDLVGGSGWFDKAVDGGADGLLQTQKFIEHASNHFKKEGIGYFVFSSLADPEKLKKIIDKNGFYLKILKSCRFNDEELIIYRVQKRKG
jgi:release factor glutamine methyltransferase